MEILSVDLSGDYDGLSIFFECLGGKLGLPKTLDPLFEV